MRHANAMACGHHVATVVLCVAKVMAQARAILVLGSAVSKDSLASQTATTCVHHHFPAMLN